MRIHFFTRRSLAFTGSVIALGLALGSSASAQDSTSAAAVGSGNTGKIGFAPASASAASALPLSLTPLSRLPLADFHQLEQAASSGSAAPSGAPGLSSTFSDGSRVFRMDQSGVAPAAFGTAGLPYTTSRAAVTALGLSSTPAQTPVTSYPYRATGKLWARFGSNWGQCTASLIGRGILVTAAHCIHNFGQRNAGYANEIRFMPANYAVNGQPYGTYFGRFWIVPDPYWNGTDTCTQRGVVCNNDIAIVVLHPQNGVLAGNRVGWYNYSWNGYSFTTSSLLGGKTVAQITQLGYPVSHDGGVQMQRTDAVGLRFTSGNLQNVILGSAQDGGSSGGPWLLNFGTVPSVSGTTRGSSTVQTIAGVTSYGSLDPNFKRQGSSWFGQNREFPLSNYGGRGAGNIGHIVNRVCSNPVFSASC